ncbi:NADP-dependent aldehyde dehydrogenase [Diaminobutyricimonas aerilata]|uniref:NADP-dependent aldehyde dehydrogenase n=1 Tax=Diaminobutyricimonas aerilata TaxID=1162967 RepID=A0A2M9CF44_9MICO|nr:aldehyde dehydrogenase (NADP(+)) [Diaminobutyricimonas aerilata]PJJ70576.1 NADP-dependent aldehyde dehydrogenase [Diaminobutyricimonas aerilata]
MTVQDTPIDEVDRVVDRAADASAAWKRTPLTDRARVLRAVADALDAAGDELVPLAQQETHLAEARLRGELARTTFQLRMFGDVLEEGTWLDARIDHADPEWPMGVPRPDIRRQLEPIGPVLVFAASNFPFAFSVAGGDTASALAAGNAVVLKAHPGHPELSAATTRVATEALTAAGAPEHLFQTIFGSDAGVHALQAPAIKAAAFTGSIAGGRALFDIASSRLEPIPFYGELGSVNPAFVTASAAAARPQEIADAFVASFTGSAGQLCTKPGVLVVPADSDIPQRLAAAALPGGSPLLYPGIHEGYVRAVRNTSGRPGVDVLNGDLPMASTDPAPTILTTTAEALTRDPENLLAEMFGPGAVVATYTDESDLLEIARILEGQLTATVIGDDGDAIAAELLPVLAEKAGRVLWNQWPTGVSVTWAQQHGGPYPATTAVGTTSVGTAAMNRFLRPVAYQNVPDALLPDALKEGNPLGIPRRVDGELVLPA